MFVWVTTLKAWDSILVSKSLRLDIHCSLPYLYCNQFVVKCPCISLLLQPILCKTSTLNCGIKGRHKKTFNWNAQWLPPGLDRLLNTKLVNWSHFKQVINFLNKTIYPTDRHVYKMFQRQYFYLHVHMIYKYWIIYHYMI